ncbi:uncharacterized protein [Bos indicus]|uniref:Uncharacterized protein n=1 Tax=Bos indicus TaxID=9915 RepID=A0ABM4SR55_BOSIN
MLLGSPLHSGPTVTGWEKPSTQQRGGGETRETKAAASARLLPQPLAPRVLSRVRAGSPPPHSPHPLSERPQRKSRRQQILGDLKEGWKKLQERSWVHSLRAGKGCRGTPPPPRPAFQKGTRGYRNRQPSRPRGANRLPTAALSSFPAPPVAPDLGRGDAGELKLTGERADAGVGEREGARCCAQLGQPPLHRLSPSVLESSGRRAAAVSFCSRAQARHPPEVPPLPPLPPPAVTWATARGGARAGRSCAEGPYGDGRKPGFSTFVELSGSPSSS